MSVAGWKYLRRVRLKNVSATKLCEHTAKPALKVYICMCVCVLECRHEVLLTATYIWTMEGTGAKTDLDRVVNLFELTSLRVSVQPNQSHRWKVQ